MLGSLVSSNLKLAGMAFAVLVLSTPVSLAANAPRLVHGERLHEAAQPSARALYGSARPDALDGSDVCIGGYRYLRHLYDSNRTAAEDEVPLVCR